MKVRIDRKLNLIITKAPRYTETTAVTTKITIKNDDGSTTTETTTRKPETKKDNFWKNLVIFGMVTRLLKKLLLFAYRLFAIFIILIVFFLAMASKPKCDNQQIVTSREMIEAVDNHDMAQVRLKIQNGETRPVCK